MFSNSPHKWLKSDSSNYQSDYMFLVSAFRNNHSPSQEEKSKVSPSRRDEKFSPVLCLAASTFGGVNYSASFAT